MIAMRFAPNALVMHPRFGALQLGPVGLYVGSGRGGTLETRVNRHLGGNPAASHYHIDYLSPLAVDSFAVRRVGMEDECGLAQALRKLDGATAVPGFGSSDCKNGCIAHYLQIPESVLPVALALARSTRAFRIA
jgi:Uri superfamily endonuclease